MTQNHTDNIVRGTLIISLLLLGISFALGANANNIAKTFSFYFFTEWIGVPLLGVLSGILFLVSACLILVNAKTTYYDQVLLIVISILCAVPLFTLFSETRWVDSLGGFPVIGTGQSIIKYFALLPLVLYLAKRSAFTLRQHALMNFFPVALVLYWIGVMKFYEFEANAIVSLVETSPLMSWLYIVLSIQEASNLIGVYDLLFATLLGFAVFKKMPRLALFSIAGAGAVFLMTQTFLFTAHGALSSTTVISGLGQFVIKDLWFIGNLTVIMHYMSSLKSN